MATTYRLVPMQGFGGLNLRDGPDAVGISEAVDLLNVEFAERGAVSQRSGFAKFSDEALTNIPDSIHPFYKVDGTRRLIVGNGNKLTVLGTDGALVTSSTSPTASPHFFTRFGGPTVEAVYIANGTDQIRRYDTAGGFTAPAGLSGQTGRFLAVQSPDNRLVSARETGTTAGNNPSSVNFSNAGDPETFAAANYVDIRPGDGEQIMGVCTWRELTFVLKESYFAVFYLNSTVGAVTTFQYRVVDGGAGLASSRALCVAEDAVYFLGRRGVYRTTGGPAQLISEPLEPFFHGRAPSAYYQSNSLAHASIATSAMWTFRDRIYVAVPTGSSTTNDRLLQFDPQGNWWSMHDIPASCGTAFRISSQEEMVFGYATGPKLIGRHSAAYRGDHTTTGATNLVTNPSFETNTTSWTSTFSGAQFGTTGATLTREADAAAPAGSYAGKVVTTGVVDEGVNFDIALTSGTVYAARIKAKKTAGGAIRIGIGNLTSPFDQHDLTVSASPATYTEYTLVFTASASTTHRFFVRATTAAATTFYVDAVQIVASATQVDYFDGDTTGPNLAPGSFEDGLGGWGWTAPQAVQSSGWSTQGSFSFRQQGAIDTTGQSYSETVCAVAAGSDYTLSATINAADNSTTGFRLALHWFDVTDTLISSSLGSYQTGNGIYSKTLTAAAPTGAVRCRVRPCEIAGAAGETMDFYFDGVQFEQASAATTYQDYGSAAYWTGTAHASTSQRLTNAGVTARWRSGWQDFGTPQEKTIRETQLWGSGALTVELSANFDTDDSVSEDVTLSEGTATKETLMRKALPGAMFSTELSNDSPNQTFTVNRLSHHLREAREPDVVST